MAIKLTATYSKKLGLPAYSSHQFSVSVETELPNTADARAESGRLYQALQEAVDTQMQQTGFVPDMSYGMEKEPAGTTPDGRSGFGRSNTPASGGTGARLRTKPTSGASAPGSAAEASTPAAGGTWKCSEKQRGLIHSLAAEHQIRLEDIDALARERFGRALEELNKLQASGVIDELLERHGGRSRPAGGNRRESPGGGGWK